MVEINCKNFEAFIQSNFVPLKNKISQKNRNKLTTKDFQEVFNTDDAGKAKNLIYIWTTEKKIPRLKGKSNIIYIGQTKTSLKRRHTPTSKLKATSKANKQKYNDIIEMYGDITVQYIKKEKFDPNNKKSLLEIERPLHNPIY